MKWELQVIPGRCESSDCTSPEIHPGEPVRLVLNGRQRWCWLCARRRLMETAPKELIPQFVPKPFNGIYVAEGRTVEPNFTPFDRQAVGEALRKHTLTRRELQEANANDPKLKQLGGNS